jgi:hypothetical protein
MRQSPNANPPPKEKAATMPISTAVIAGLQIIISTLKKWLRKQLPKYGKYAKYEKYAQEARPEATGHKKPARGGLGISYCAASVSA